MRATSRPYRSHTGRSGWPTRSWIWALSVMLVLSACATIPTSGPVREGQAVAITPAPVVPIVEGPRYGDDARAIVRGFLTASAAGAVTGFDVAREYLTPEAAASWDPLAQVVIFDSRSVAPTWDETNLTATYSLPVAALTDATGVLREVPTDVRRDVKFRIIDVPEVGFRIAELEPGIVLSEVTFAQYFRPVELVFATSDRRTIVPELRWFPNNENIATKVVQALVAGPSPWLVDAVLSGFIPGSDLALQSVVVTDGRAEVALTQNAAGDLEQRALVAEQLRHTLTQLPNVRDVQVTAGSLPIGGQDSVFLQRAPIPSHRAAVLLGNRLGMWDGEKLWVMPEAAGELPETAHSIALSYDANTVAYVFNGSMYATQLTGANGLLEPADSAVLAAELAEREAAEAAGQAAARPLLEGELVIPGTNLVGASFDRWHWLWSAEKNFGGELVVSQIGGSQIMLPVDWLTGRSIQALSVSKDGSRLAVLSRVRDTGEQVLEVAGVIRDPLGVPVGVSQPAAVGAEIRPAIALVWADETTVTALGEQQGEVQLVTFGGRVLDLPAVGGAVQISARFSDRSVVVVSDDGNLRIRSGTGWTTELVGVRDIAYSG